ncbi:hypothetical protein AA310_03100 [Arthrobacter sp. YC-RL1]|uniref:hypothetical protein n=1 Tax=unclassified Arthrobacter TaxID=235627 RepID=UPI00063DA263|nr:hypothetical protein [Arthrobacter sp. YC-RL1]ALQ32053.1 hypothetical protein ATC04_16910 [Arthrobacter sp. YC-RL1]KLI90352.1 hypothetical protein AA310_03100 [Arthrobacter sp. YC-RL1]
MSKQTHLGLAAKPLTANPLPRFANDWISAWLQLDGGTGLLHIGAGPREWILEPLDPTALGAAVDPGTQIVGQFNPDLKIALIPGSHLVAGSSFFRLRA